ncbi:cytochrome P450 [Catenaria anguillulae PL171]|uniref:Cytochrome P450 n=1 Tax=Catenaria anguillulae PL171 TaxID=765915 RepID=A0A1Y2H765_9FUNG|nr:cytochrome P450 [Catenaria anguillulae PL171]
MPVRPSVLAILTLSSLAAIRFYWTSIRVPPHLRHLPRIPIPTFLWMTMRGNNGFLQTVEEQGALLVADSVRRGYTPDAQSTPPLWLFWMLGTWVVAIDNPQDFKDAMLLNETFEKLDVTSAFPDESTRLLGASNIVNDKTPVWRRHRKIVNPAFRRGWATSLFGTPARELLAAFDAHVASGSPVDVSQWMQRMALDALTTAAFGENIDSINHPHSRIVALYNEVVHAATDPAGVVLGPLAKLLPRRWGLGRKVDEFNRYLTDMIDTKVRMVKEKKAMGEHEDDADSKDLMELMVSAMIEDEAAFSKEDVRANTMIFFLAGHDTTANALAFAIYLLGRHPEIQAKARAEVLKVMSTDAPSTRTPASSFPYPSNTQERQLHYLTCIIKETLRLFPSITMLPMREMHAAHTFSDHARTSVPKGAYVAANVWGIHRSPKYWGDNVHDFVPERWMTAAEAGVGSEGVSDLGIPLHPGAHEYRFVPFGGGPRQCLGMQFSVIEQRVVLAMLLMRYEWTVVGDKHALSGMPLSDVGILLHPKNVFVDFKRRN